MTKLPLVVFFPAAQGSFSFCRLFSILSLSLYVYVCVGVGVGGWVAGCVCVHALQRKFWQKNVYSNHYKNIYGVS